MSFFPSHRREFMGGMILHRGVKYDHSPYFAAMNDRSSSSGCMIQMMMTKIREFKERKRGDVRPEAALSI